MTIGPDQVGGAFIVGAALGSLLTHLLSAQTEPKPPHETGEEQ